MYRVQVFWSLVRGNHSGRWPCLFDSFLNGVDKVVATGKLVMLHSRPLTSLFFICFSRTWFQFMRRIQGMTLWWNDASLSRLRFVKFQDLQPQRRALSYLTM